MAKTLEEFEDLFTRVQKIEEQRKEEALELAAAIGGIFRTRVDELLSDKAVLPAGTEYQGGRIYY